MSLGRSGGIREASRHLSRLTRSQPGLSAARDFTTEVSERTEKSVGAGRLVQTLRRCVLLLTRSELCVLIVLCTTNPSILCVAR